MATSENKPGGPNSSLLQFQNQKLSAQLEVQRKEITELENKVEELKKKEGDYADTLLCVNRLWNQVQSDIQLLCTRAAKGENEAAGGAGDEAPSSVKEEDDEEVADVKNDGGIVQDPFLERLLTAGSASAKKVHKIQKEIADGATDLEQKLAGRCTATKRALADLLDVINAQKQRRHDAVAASTASEETAELRKEVAAVAKEAEEARREADAAAALQRTLEHKVEQLDEERLRQDKAIQDMLTEQAELQQAYAASQRKLATMKSGDQTTLQASSMGLGGLRGSGSMRLSSEGAAELEEVQKLADKRAADLDQEREIILKLTRELREARAAVHDEAHVQQTRMYTLATRQIQALTADAEKLRAQLETLQREREELVRRQQHLQLQVEGAAHTNLMMRHMEKRVKELEKQLKAAVVAANEAEAKLQREKEKVGQAKTVAELKLMVATLQKEIGVLQATQDKQKGLSQQIDGYRKESQDARDVVRANEIELQRLADKVRQQEGEIVDLRAREDKLKLLVEDLHIFVQLLSDVSDEPVDVTQLRQSEARLREQLNAAEAQLEGHSLQETIGELKKTLAEKEGALAELQKQLDGRRVAAARAEDVIKDLEKQVTAAKGEAEAYLSEMVVIGGAYEDMQAQNTRLLQLLTERDEANNQLVNESIRAAQNAAQLAKDQEAAKAAVIHVEAAANVLRTRVAELESKLQASIDEVTSLRERSHGYAAQAEALGRKVAEAEEVVKQKSVLVEDAQRVAAERKKAAEEEAERAFRERNKRQHQEDEMKALSSKLEKMRKLEEAGGSGKLMAGELNTLRTLLNCNVCHERQKNVIITKCWHMFCEPCIKRNLDSRNRKCPGCSQLFAATDVKHFFFT